MKRSSHLLFILVFALMSFTYADQDYSGSQAYNRPQLLKESVNAATGTFDFSYSLISNKGKVDPLELNLTYRFNKVGMFALPTGWQFDIDYIDNHTAHIHNQEWLIDRLWHDEKGFASGLKYYNLHGTRFEDEGVSKAIPNYNDKFYRYKASHKDGSIKYFSHQGLLVLQVDRFNNSIAYDYIKPVTSLRAAKLKTITDNYGHQYQFTYAPNEITLTMPDHSTKKIYVNNDGVIRLADALDQRIDIEYTEAFDKTLIRTIESHTGLITKLSYESINYKLGSSTKQLPVVTLVEKVDGATDKKLQETHYTYSPDKNFTGYPNYGFSDSSDSLMDSNDKAYRYSVEIAQNELVGDNPQLHKKIYYYNYLHLPIEVHTLNDGVIHQKTCYEYAISPFKYSRSTNYDKPSVVTNYIWNKHHNVFIPSDKTETLYDDYGNKIKEQRQVFDRLYWVWKPMKTTEKTFYNNFYGLEKSSVKTDERSGMVIRTEYSLAKDNKSQQYKIISFKDNKEASWQKWQQHEIQHDHSGRIVYSAKSWLAKHFFGPEKTFTKKTYHYNTHTASLTISTQSALGSTLTEVIDTRNNQLLSKETPEKEQWQFEYDLLGQLTKEINPLGHSTTFEYKTYQADNRNETIKTTPRGYKMSTQADAIGQIITKKDHDGSTWRTLESSEFNGWGKLIKKTNILGLSEVTAYDNQKRPLIKTDPWGNQIRTEYNDLALKTTTYKNKHKVHERESVPWLSTIIDRKFPIYDNPHDPQEHFIEETLERNGFGKKYKHSSAVVNRYTLEKEDEINSEYRHDANMNVVSKSIKGFDDSRLTRTNTFDIFNNRIKTHKVFSQHSNKSEHESDTRRFDEDNRLVEEKTPAAICGQSFLTTHSYDKNGRRIHTLLPNNQEIHYEYDKLGQLIRHSWVRNNQPYFIQKIFDEDSKLIELKDAYSEQIQYGYTPDGKIVTIEYPDDRSMSYSYDKFNRITRINDYTGTGLSYTYNASDKGKLSTIRIGENSINYTYGSDENGQKGQLTSRSTSFTNLGKTDSYFSYGPFQHLAKVTNLNNQTGSLYNVNYLYDTRGRLKQQSSYARKGHLPAHYTQVSYEYDALNHIIKEQHKEGSLSRTIHYVYDGNHNLIEESYQSAKGNLSLAHQYNQLDQRILTTSVPKEHKHETYYYSPNGHLVKTPDGTQYDYDALGYLTKVTASHGVATDYSYWPNGLLQEKSQKDLTQKFYYNANKQIINRSVNDNFDTLIRRQHQIIASLNNQGASQFFLANKSTGALLDAKGEFSHTDYTAYGQPNKELGQPNSIADFGWNQEYTDPNAQLTYMQSRFYHNQFKLFISRDSIRVDNRYAYANGNPIMFTDPSGHSPVVNYSLGGGITALGILGAVFSIPTGGASLTLTAGAGIAAGVAATISGISLMGSQAALDSGNKQAAKALQYTSIGFGAAALTGLSVAIAPYVAGFFFGPGEVEVSDASIGFTSSAEIQTLGSLIWPVGPIEKSTPISLTSSTAEIAASSPKLSAGLPSGISEGSETTISAASQGTYNTSVTSSFSIDKFMSRGSSLTDESLLTSSPSYDTPNSAVYASPLRVNSVPLNTPLEGATNAASKLAGTFSNETAIYEDMSGAVTKDIWFDENYEDMSGLILDGLDKSSSEELLSID